MRDAEWRRSQQHKRIQKRSNETSNFPKYCPKERCVTTIQIYSVRSVDGSFRAAMAMRSDLWERNSAFALWTSSQWQQQKADCRTMWANPEVESLYSRVCLCLMRKCKVLKLFDHLVKGKRDCWNISETSKIWSSHTILQCTCLACKYSQSIMRDSWTDSVNFPQGLGNFPQEFRGRELGAESSRLCHCVDLLLSSILYIYFGRVKRKSSGPNIRHALFWFIWRLSAAFSRIWWTLELT